MKSFIKIICLFAAVSCLSLGLFSCDEQKELDPKAFYNAAASDTGVGTDIRTMFVEREVNSMNVGDFVPTDEMSDYVLLSIKNHGSIVVLLRRDVAPVTVENFKGLASEKFFDGTIFHRVVENFMIQGGGFISVSDGNGNSTIEEKPCPSIIGEFDSNGFENNLSHIRGVISMARTSEKDSASSQFFIIHQDSPHLNGDYAAFGYVVAGMDVVDAIATCQVLGKGTDAPIPLNDVVIESVNFVKLK